jgi:hypothetical protein
LLALLRYEPALLLLGLPAVAWALLRGSHIGKQMALWLGLCWPLLLLQAARPLAAARSRPGVLLIGLLAGDLLAAPLPAGAVARQRAAADGAGGRRAAPARHDAAGQHGPLHQTGTVDGRASPLIGLAVLAFVLPASLSFWPWPGKTQPPGAARSWPGGAVALLSNGAQAGI